MIFLLVYNFGDIKIAFLILNIRQMKAATGQDWLVPEFYVWVGLDRVKKTNWTHAVHVTYRYITLRYLLKFCLRRSRQISDRRTLCC